MLFGAVIGFIVALNSGHLWLGVLLAMVAGMLLSALFAVVALLFNANQVATGLALTIFGVGLSTSVGAAWVGKPPGRVRAGSHCLAQRNPADRAHAVYPGPAGVPVVCPVCRGLGAAQSRVGLIIQAVGENPDAASAMGIPVLRVRTLAVLFGGAMAGLAGLTCRWPTRRCGQKT